MQIDESLEQITIAVDADVSSVSYFHGYPHLPLHEPGRLERELKAVLKGALTIPEELRGRYAEVEIAVIRLENRRIFEKDKMIGTVLISERHCEASLELSGEALRDVLDHYFLFREPAADHFHVTLYLKEPQHNTDAHGERIGFRIYGIDTGWGR